MKLCPLCVGTGSQYTTVYRKCRICDGKKFVTKERFRALKRKRTAKLMRDAHEW